MLNDQAYGRDVIESCNVITLDGLNVEIFGYSVQYVGVLIMKKLSVGDC